MCKSTCVANEDKESFAICHLQLENVISEVEAFLTLTEYMMSFFFFFLLSALNLEFGRTTNIPTEGGRCLDTVGRGGKKIKTTESWILIHEVKFLLSAACCVSSSHSHASQLSQEWALLLPGFEPYPCDKAEALWGSWQAGSVQSGLQLWWFVMRFCREMFLCNVFLCHNWNQCFVSVDNLKKADKNIIYLFIYLFISTIHTFAEVELDETDCSEEQLTDDQHVIEELWWRLLSSNPLFSMGIKLLLISKLLG